MATFVVCPLCAKSSLIEGFPSGPGSDIFVQSLKGRGRGKGWAVASRTSALDDEELCGRLTRKVLELVNALLDHGHLETWQLPNPPIVLALQPPPDLVPETAKRSIAQGREGSLLERLKDRSHSDQLRLFSQTLELIELYRKLKVAKVGQEVLVKMAKEILAETRARALELAVLLGLEVGRLAQLSAVVVDFGMVVWDELQSNGFRPLEQEAVDRLAVAIVRCFERVKEIDPLFSYLVLMRITEGSHATERGPSGHVAASGGGSVTDVVPPQSDPSLAIRPELERPARENEPQAPILAERNEPVAVAGARQTPDPLIERGKQVIAALGDPIARSIADSMRSSAPRPPPSVTAPPTSVPGAGRLKGSVIRSTEAHTMQNSGPSKGGVRRRRRRRPRARA